MNGQQPNICHMVTSMTDCLTRVGTALHYMQRYQEVGGRGNLEQVRTHIARLEDQVHALAADLRTLHLTETLVSDLDSDLERLEQETIA